MKKIINILSLVAVAAFTFVSCQKEAEKHEPGPQETAGCYGVYFPVQAASGSHVYSPVDDPSIDIVLARTNTSGSITVPIVTSFSENVFTVGAATFADGQDETVFTVRFDNAQEGVTYKASFVIEDNQYASLYSSNAIGLDFDVMRVQMNTLKDESGNDAVVTITVHNDFLGDFGYEDPSYTLSGTIQYYEVDGVRYCQLIPSQGGVWFSDAVINFNWYPKATYTVGDATYQPIEVPSAYTGYDLPGSEVGMDSPCPVYFKDYYWYWTDRGNNLGTFLDFVDNYSASYPVSYYDGHGGFYFNLIYTIEGTNYWYGYNENSVVAIASGYTRTDYSIKVKQAGVSESGQVPVTFTLGEDVAKVVYTFAEGTLTATQIANAVAALDFNSEDAITDGSGTYLFDLGVTGPYTLVAATYNKDGKQQQSASCAIVYLSEDDAEEYAVVVNGGLGSAAKYIPSGVNTDNSLEYYIYGKDLVEVKFAAFSFADLASNYEACVSALMETNSVSDEILAEINDSGNTGVISGLLPGTEYYLLVYASNGYSEAVKYFGSEFTTGDPLKIYQKFSADDIDGSLLPEHSEGYFGTYNFYSVNFYDNTTGLREYTSKVTIADSEIPDSDPDANGIVSEYVEISGMFAAAAEYYGFDDTQLWEFYNGVLYNLGAEGQQLGPVADGKYYAQLFVLTDAGNIYRNYGSMLVGGFVDDGYVAFASSELYNEGTLNENGLFLRFYGDEAYSSAVGNVDGFTEMLLVDVEKDDNGVAPASVTAKKAQLRAISKEIQEARTNYVESTSGRIRSIIDKHNKNSVSLYNQVAKVKGIQNEIRLVVPKSVEFAGYTVNATPEHKLAPMILVY